MTVISSQMDPSTNIFAEFDRKRNKRKMPRFMKYNYTVVLQKPEKS